MTANKIAALTIALVLLGFTSVGYAEDKPKPDKDGFVSMFDGESLKGWQAIPADCEDAWYIKDGYIVGEGDKGRGYLSYHQGDIADFEMKFRYRFPGKGNSGVNIRSIKDKTGKRHFQSYHADIGNIGIGKNVLGAWDFHTPERKEHGVPRGKRLVIDENDKAEYTDIDNPTTLDDISEKGWNKCHIVAKGNKFTFYLNGKLTAEFVEHLPAKKRLHKGTIQLQLHDPKMFVHFDDLKIKIMK